MSRVEYLHTQWGSLMKLPFNLALGHLAVIVPRPKVRSRTVADGSVIHEAHNIEYLNLKSERGLFDIGFMLNYRQFANQTAAERFTILALQRRLTFSHKLTFPNLRDTGDLFSVEASAEKLVWATIPGTVIPTSKFTVLDLHDQDMALDESDALRETIELAIQGCPGANAEEILERFYRFKAPHPTDIRRALNKLEPLGFVREYIDVDRLRRRAVFNMRMVASTRSGILRGMIAAEDLLRRVDGQEVTFSVDLATVEPPVKRAHSTTTGRRRNITKAQYQSKSHTERDLRIKAEKRISEYEGNGYLTHDQFARLRHALDDPAISIEHRETIKQILATALSDPLTEIPEFLRAKDKRHA